MSVYTQQAAQTLTDFVAGIQLDNVSEGLASEVAKLFWQQMETDARSNLQSLRDAIPRLSILTDDALEDFGDIFGFSADALEWAEEDELSYVESVTETPALLLTRLCKAGYILAQPHSGVVEAWARADVQYELSSQWAYAQRGVGAGRYSGAERVAACYPPPPHGTRTCTNPDLGRGLLFNCD